MAEDELRALALAELGEVGDTEAGEWWEWTGKAGHLRRRLSEHEATSVGPVVDIRGTKEAVHRISRVLSFVPKHLRETVAAEVRRPV